MVDGVRYTPFKTVFPEPGFNPEDIVYQADGRMSAARSCCAVLGILCSINRKLHNACTDKFSLPCMYFCVGSGRSICKECHNGSPEVTTSPPNGWISPAAPPPRRIPAGEKPYACSMCPRRFSNQSQVAPHERTHTGEKPYACSMCLRRFSDKGNLARHERTHTSE